MSVDWIAVNPVLISVFSACAVDAQRALDNNWTAEWEERPRTMASPVIKFTLSLKITSIVGYGNDEIRYGDDDGQPDPTTNLLQRNICGLRKMTLQVKCECEENIDHNWAFQTIERIRTRLNAEEYTAQLLAVQVSIIDILDGRDVTYSRGKRRVSAAVMPVIFSIAVNDTGMPAIGWIESILLSSEISGGVNPPNFTDLSIP